MWMLLPALSLALVHIAGDNAGVVPDAAALSGAGIYAVVVLAYFLLGAGLTALAAWIGVRAGCELAVVVRRLLGERGKRVFAAVTLAVSIPASALTGCYFAGWLVHGLTGLPPAAAAALCLAVFTLLAAGYWRELLVISNYSSLLLVPALLLLLALAGPGEAALGVAGDGGPDWPLVLALFAYNAGGMRPALAAEAAACLAKRGGRAVGLMVAAKLAEGVFTLVMAHIVIAAGTAGPLALAAAAGKLLGAGGGLVFTVILLCTFANTMVPAMVVNARHLACAAGIAAGPALAVAAAAVYLTSFLNYGVILRVMAVAGLVTAVFVAYIAFVLHKKGRSQQ